MRREFLEQQKIEHGRGIGVRAGIVRARRVRGSGSSKAPGRQASAKCRSKSDQPLGAMVASTQFRNLLYFLEGFVSHDHCTVEQIA